MLRTSVEEKIAIVQIYIHHKADKEVNISPVLPKEAPLLERAYRIANQWIRENIILK
ncbi:hypothetical protein Phi40:1_gp035 [Cellulophaga phage phi40:1]|jgi:hypothetical protein|uniref:Uncharacterized protein n=1 Tax=Cellulophaga phage phi38:1 TaxID=1327977 RepID=R9ZZX1_9CAUD|nr:hypothetical protein Phi38:1_gp035 [Cellulophaga phage phi38:1]AGO47900.1 hypothetical protein Phi40:1_gp035 [Cellulophaga phage phi40:1]AGO48065.1 hypothetical protein Phi38:1_gp035 [Cellulophaga phage phi38:1]|tara:strand:+ start:626 stop:796 length:171 start_codon:yes stop_codon:yes gene_type:complete